MENEISLEERVRLFRTLRLPGQGLSMHMGTAYLVGDLWKRIEELEADLKLTSAMLAKQCDMAREAETRVKELEALLKDELNRRHNVAAQLEKAESNLKKLKDAVMIFVEWAHSDKGRYLVIDIPDKIYLPLIKAMREIEGREPRDPK